MPGLGIVYIYTLLRFHDVGKHVWKMRIMRDGKLDLGVRCAVDSTLSVDTPHSRNIDSALRV